MVDACNLPIHSSAYIGGDCLPVQQLVLSDHHVDFELNLNGDRTPPQIVTVYNPGPTIRIRKVILSAGSEDFRLIDDNGYPDIILNGESFTIVIEFEARVDGIALGLLQIYTNEGTLPYLINLKSRTQRAPSFADLYGDVLSRITTERTQRINADALEVSARVALDASLRALVSSTDLAERTARIAADDALRARLNYIENVQTGGGLSVIDNDARAMIIEERGVRVTALAAEAFYRLQLRSDFDTATSAADARITEEITTRATALAAQATRLTTIEASYQSFDQVNAIATAKITEESIARSSALAAEASERTLLAATLRTEADSKLALEAITRNALIANEQAARVTADSASASNLLDMSASITGARGITPNATFDGGRTGWITGMSFVTKPNGKIVPTSRVGEMNTLYSAKRIFIDTNRVYEVNVSFETFNAPIAVYAGVACLDSDGNTLGNIYSDHVYGQAVLGTKTEKFFITGTAPYPIPTYRAGNTFPEGTVSVQLIVYMNWGNPSPVPDGYGEMISLWLDDITNSFSSDARITEEQIVRSTADGALSSRVSTTEANYISANNSIANLQSADATQAANIIAANARIDTEQTARATALSAEVTRVNSLLANFQTTDPTNQINTAVAAEATARTTAISNAMSAEVTRVNNLLTSYTTTSGMNSAINTAVSAEITSRDTAISNAMGAEVIRVNNILTSYTSTTGMNSAINVAVNTEITNRTTAISNAVSGEATRVDNILLNYSTTGAVSSIVTAAVSAETSARVTADSANAGRSTALETRAGNLESRTGIVETVAANSATKLASARLELSAVTGSNRAQLTLKSDNNGGAGVDIIGDVNITGNNGGATTLIGGAGIVIRYPNGQIMFEATI